MKTHCLMLFFCLMIANACAQAQNKSAPKLKSETLAKLFAYDPIPADALFYGEKYVQGGLNTLIGLPTGIAFWSILIGGFSDDDLCEGGDDGTGDVLCQTASVHWSAMERVAGVLSGLLYIGSLAWDGSVGLTAVKKHNERVQAQSKVRLKPRLQAFDKRLFVGLGGQF